MNRIAMGYKKPKNVLFNKHYVINNQRTKYYLIIKTESCMDQKS